MGVFEWTMLEEERDFYRALLDPPQSPRPVSGRSPEDGWGRSGQEGL